MGRYTDNYCAVCFRELLRPQNTCGALACLTEYRGWNAQMRFSRKNLAHMPPSERAIVMVQGPSDEELQEQTERRELLASELEQHEQQQTTAGKVSRGDMPDSLKSVFTPEDKSTAPTHTDFAAIFGPKIKKEGDPIGNSQPINDTDIDPTGS